MTLLTEDEARKETCPFIRFIVNENDVLQHGRAPIYVHQNCKASDCRIGWRVAKRVSIEAPPDKFGYCGAFGEPNT